MNTDVNEIKSVIPLTGKKGREEGQSVHSECGVLAVSAQPLARISTQPPHVLTSDSRFFIRDCAISYAVCLQPQMNKNTRIALI